MKIAALTLVSLIAFAANSVLARLALHGAAIDPFAYAGLRIVSAALVLAAILLWRQRKAGGPWPWQGGSWGGALAFVFYALPFAAAYVMMETAPGALILFAATQFSMLAWAVARGERPRLLEWAGIALAFGALVYLLLPGLTMPPPLSAALLMAFAGCCWGAYCLVGRGSSAPLADTAGNFVRGAPLGLALLAVGLWRWRPTPFGLACALASGAICSGLGYVVWYGALPYLSRTRAALVQLSVPVIAAAGGVAFIGEVLTPRLVLAAAGVIGGIALALVAARSSGTPAAVVSEPNA